MLIAFLEKADRTSAAKSCGLPMPQLFPHWCAAAVADVFFCFGIMDFFPVLLNDVHVGAHPYGAQNRGVLDAGLAV